MEFSTISEMFLQVTDHFRGHPTKKVFLRKVNKQYTGISHDELREMTENFAMGLLELGFESGDRIGIVSENRLEWIVADFAITGIGAVDVPIFPTLMAKQEAYIFSHSGTRAIIVSNTFQLNKILKVKEELPDLQYIIVMNNDVQTSDPSVLFMSDVLRQGAESMSADERRKRFEALCRAVKPDHLLTIIYTSGTTGNPKGVMLTHRNLVSNIQGAAPLLPIGEQDLFLSYLPLCHTYERMAGYYTVFSCLATTAFAESIETVAENLREIRPTLMTSVPRLFERIKNKIYANVEKDSPIKQKIFYWAIQIGKDYMKAKDNGKISPILLMQHTLADKLVFGKIRERMGGRLRAFVSGGAALPRDVGEFFHAVGLKIMEGYGLTESSPAISFTRFEDIQIGTVGKPLWNVQVKIAEDGEILAKGDNIMKGYLNDEAATREAIDEEGWLHTGDIGIFNERGNIVITDRKKNIFVSSGGKNITPQPIENALSESRYIDQILLIGDNREYCTALIVPEFDAAKAFLQSNGISAKSVSEIVANPELIREITRDINDSQRDFSKYEKVRKFTLLDTAFTVENGFMTPTLKIKRKEVEKNFAKMIEKMY